MGPGGILEVTSRLQSWEVGTTVPSSPEFMESR